MRVLLTGAAGFIGAHFFRSLAAQGVPVLGLVRREASASSERRVAELNALGHTHTRVARYDSDTEKDAAIRAFRPTACVHLAGRSSVRESLANPGLYEAANLRDTIALLTMLREVECRRVVHTSTVMVYGPDASFPCRENKLGSGPLSFYGASKLAAENVLNTWRQMACMESINLRLFSVYGPDLREDSVPSLLVRALLDKRTFKILGDGSSQRDYVDVNDVLAALHAALICPWTPDFPTALNVGSGAGTSLRRLIELLEERLGTTLLKETQPAVHGEIPAIVADIGLAQEVLGYKPSMTLEAGLDRVVNWFRSAGHA